MSLSPVTASGPTVRVLVVDDNRDAAQVLRILLKTCGYEVDMVLDSSECLAHLESFKPAVLLLDIGMPRISGYTLAKQIRARQEFARMAIIAISGYADAEHVQQSLDAGCDQHLAKPADLATIEAAIALAVEKRQSPPAGAFH